MILCFDVIYLREGKRSHLSKEEEDDVIYSVEMQIERLKSPIQLTCRTNVTLRVRQTSQPEPPRNHKLEIVYRIVRKTFVYFEIVYINTKTKNIYK